MDVVAGAYAMGMAHLRFPDIPGQRGLATAAQLRAHGWTYSALSHLVATSGQRILPRVYLPHHGRIPDDDLIVAGWLWAGTDTLLTGAAALVRHGVKIPRPGPITRFLTRRDGRNREGNLGMELRRTRRLPTGPIRNDVRVVSVERALVDAGRYKEASARDLKGWAMAALQNNLTTPDRLDAEITASGWQGLAALSAGCKAFRRGSWSPPEATLFDLIEADERFPQMLANPRLVDDDDNLIGCPDGYFPDEGVVLQVHSKQFHRDPDHDGKDPWPETVEADNDYQRYGLVVVGVTPTSIDFRPVTVLDTLYDTLLANRGRAITGVHVQVRDPE